MKTGDWEKAKRIFGDAIKVAPGERPRFLDEVCADDAETRREVESLLVSFDDAESFMETPAAHDITSLTEDGSKILEQGKRFGHYEIVKLIGAGGMGEVYLAEDKKLDRRVAVKILNEQFSQQESNLERFIREAKAASGLNHPNILVIHEIGESENSSYIISEFIEGQTLREIVRATPMQAAEILDIAIQIVSALAAAHEAHIVHRDIKPENIMIRPDGYVKILDFGLAKLIEQKPLDLEDATAKLNQTAKGLILGTVNYMSPEQAKGEKVEERTDIFSLGVVLYEMIAGRTPFAGASMPETFANLINAEPLPLARFASNVPNELQRIVSKMLRKHRDERYQTMKELLADLKSLQKRLDIEAELGQRKSSEQIAKKETQTFKTSEGSEAQTAMLPPAPSDAKEIPLTETNTDVGQTLRDKPKPSRTLLTRFLFGLMLLAVLGLGYWFYVNRSSSGSSKSAPIESMAVMPFVNESGNADVEYLSDGMTDTLINSLSRLPHLSVKARSSVFRYKGKEVDPQRTAAELNVQAILTGRLVQRGDDLTLYLSLVDARTGNQLWGEQYNRKLTDLITLQSEIARDVSQKLQTRLSGVDEQKVAKNYTANPEAYQLYLKGRYFWNKRTAESIKRAIEYFNQAIEKDPLYALAYAGLADSYSVLTWFDNQPSKEVYPKAKVAALKALDLDDRLAEAHAALGQAKGYSDWDFAGAEIEYRRAIESDPNYAVAHYYYAEMLSQLGRHDEAIAEANMAQQLDPLSPIVKVAQGAMYEEAGRCDESLEILRKAIEADKDSPRLHREIVFSYECKRMYEEAIAEYQNAERLAGDLSAEDVLRRAAILREAYRKSGEKGYWQGRLELLIEDAKRKPMSSADFASIYASLGDKEKALEWLEKAYQQREFGILYIKIGQNYKFLRDDPRFQDLLRRVGFMP